MSHGRYCESGMAVIKDGNKMMCVEISDIKSNLDAYAAPQEKPAKCRLVMDQDDACKYYYADQNGNQQELNKEFCECSLMEALPEDGILEPEPIVWLPKNKTVIEKKRI